MIICDFLDEDRITETEINDYRMMVILETRCPRMKDRAIVSQNNSNTTKQDKLERIHIRHYQIINDTVCN